MGSKKRNLDKNGSKSDNNAELNGTKLEVLPLTLQALSSDFVYNDDESPVPLTVFNPGFEMKESIITPKGASQKRSVPREKHERSYTRKSPRLASSTALVVDPLDSQGRHLRRSPRLSPEMVQPKNAGKNQLEMHQKNCLRRSPRLSPISSCPQIEGPKLKKNKSCVKEVNFKQTNSSCKNQLEIHPKNCLRRSPRLSPISSCPQIEGPKLKKTKSCVKEVKFKQSNGRCKKLALPAPSSTLTENVDLIPIGETAISSALKSYECKKEFIDLKSNKKQIESFFVGEPVPEHEAQERWGWRYDLKSKRRKGQSWILNAGEEDEVHLNVVCHYLQAHVGGCIFSLGDCAHIEGEGKQPHVGRIVEFFKTSDDENYFRVQWFYRAEDTVMKQAAAFHDKKRLFSSSLMNDNLLECLLSKVKVIEKAPTLGFQATSIQPYEYYCDMEYSVKYSTFRSLVPDSLLARCDLSIPNSINMAITTTPLNLNDCEMYKSELALLDLYAGCGGMSTGLCLGAKLSGVKLVTRWAIDYHKSACDSLKLNHPETEVRHTTAEDFLELLKEWEKLCKIYVFNDDDIMIESSVLDADVDADVAPGEYEISSLVDICYGDPSRTGQHGLKFKVRWKGYDPSEDTWEPIEGLSDCQGHIQDFVRSGYKSKILPCPGDVDVICGGPPCQGISGYNRYRNTVDPLNDERNQQIVVFFDIVKFLNPKYVLMENVADILRFDKASLGRYALSRLVNMNYQARLGIMAAGSYGLPQFRLRVFLWGAHPNQKLPQFPLPTHEVIVRYFPPAEFEGNTVAYDEGQPRKLEDAIVLRDAISDLPAVTSHEEREEMLYDKPPETEFQKYIRLTKEELTGSVSKGITDWKSSLLTDHRPYKLSEDDFHRVCYVPHKKGANFRDFPGVIVNADNTVQRDPTIQVLLPSGRPLLPNFVFTFEKGKSKRPFARVWWDENVPTVVTFPSIHNQAALHPEQDRVFTLRECARLQGFPDHYRFCGNVKERYCQVGNAVAVSVSKTLGYALGMAFKKLSGDEALMTLPPGFAFQTPPFHFHEL